MDLFLDKLPDMFKEAAFAARLSDTPESWPQELTSELYRQLPFLSDYDVNVNLDRVEAQRGFAFGYADIANKTERPEPEHDQAGLPHIRIPIVVLERSVKPFSVFLDGERVLPLTEERVRELLFNPQTFDISASQPRDPSLVETLMPPSRSGVGMGGEYKMASIEKEAIFGLSKKEKITKDWTKAHNSFTDELNQSHNIDKFNDIHDEILKEKHGIEDLNSDEAHDMRMFGVGYDEVYKHPYFKAMSDKHFAEFDKKWGSSVKKTASILEAIAPTIKERDAEEFSEKVANDPYLISGFRNSGIAETLVKVIDQTERISGKEVLATVIDNVLPDVVTIQRLPGGDFLVKSANSQAFVEGAEAQGQVVPEQEVSQAIGQDNAAKMSPGQSVTSVSNPVNKEDLNVKKDNSKVIEEFGQYKVQDTMGNSLVGHVFPQTLAWDGNFTPQPVALFTNGSAYAVQEGIAGEMVGKGTNLPRESPRGDGCFYSVDGGDAIATAPLTIKGSAAGPDGLPKFIGVDVFGTEVHLSLSQGLTAPQRLSDIEYVLPDTWKFMRLNNQTQLIPDPLQMNKSASIKEANTSVVLFYNGSYNLAGGCGLEKLSSAFRQEMDPITTEFVLGLLGVSGSDAKIKIAEARKKGEIKIAGLRPIILMRERFQESIKEASALMSKIPNLKVDLLKEAAAMSDKGTADNILALNFINEENLPTFISYIPELEQTSEKLAEMLLHCYMGMNELPESAIERAMKNLEEVLLALKGLAHANG